MTVSTLDPWQGAAPPEDDGVFVFPASYAQRRLWFLDQLAPGSAVYNLPLAWRLRGPLDPAALEEALAGIVARHEPLRTTFAMDEEAPVQVVSPPGWSFPFLPWIDLEALPAEQRGHEALRLAADEAARPFDLERGPLFRASLVWIGRGDHALLSTFHHIVSDGVSLGVFQSELAAFYRTGVTGRPALLPDLPIQYADFAVWQRDWLEGEALKPQLAWWTAQLDGAPRVLELPFRARPAVSQQGRQRGAWRAAGIPRGVANALREVGQGEGATRFMTLLAAFEVLLHLCTGREDLVVGTPVSGRTQVETEGLIGLFVNTLALRTELSGVASFRELLARVRESALGAFGHQDLPFERLVEELQPERSLALNPLVQVTFSLQERGTDRGLDLEGVEAGPLRVAEDRGEGMAKFDLALFVEETPRGMAVRLDWDVDLMDEVDALRLLESFRTLLAGIVEDPWRPLWSLPVLPEAARHQLLVEWNDSGSPWRDLPLAEGFAAQAARTPDAVALVSGTEAMTYAELDRQSNRLARRLRALGVGPEARVGVALERTPVLISALIAVHKAGGAYVPLDPAYPRERLALILEDAQEGMDDPVLVTTSSLLDRLPAFDGRILLLDEPIDESDESLAPLAGPGNLAYLIYTSGSTGRPKGVAIEHRSAAALLEWAAEVFAPEELSGVLAATSVTFDLSVYEIFLPLTRGGTVVLAENALALPELPARESVTLVNTVPSAIGALVRSNGIPSSVRTVNLAGEPLKRALVDALYAVPTVESVYNLYGPSEDTTYSTWTRVPRGEEREPTIGIPLANTLAHVLDRWLRPLPVGVPGELFLAGAGLARGYLNRPDLTAAAFVPDPFRGGERLYRTGDLARRLADGRLEFLGRIDHQVKVRGFRIELGEIESHLLAHPDVREAAVLALGEGAERSLVGYVVAPPTGAGGVRDFLAGRLPAYMVPAVVILDALPLTPNGKVDRKALAALAPDWEAGGDTTAAPRTATEELLAGIWADVLRVERVGVHDSFFDLGGHSLLATQLVSRVRETFRTDLPLRALFEAPTVAGLATRVESARRVALPPILPVPRDRDLPASFAQERLWFLEQLGGDVGSSYSLPSPFRLRGPLSVPALAAALGALADRHESLRTTFAATTDGTVLQRIAPAAGLPLPLLDLSALPDPEAEALRLAAGDARRPFDLRTGPLVRATLLRLADDDHALLLTMHHIVLDGWSLRVLIRELKALYAGDSLPELPVQYADFAAWQRGWLTGGTLDAEIAWWRERLSGLPAVLDLPTDRPRPAVRSSRGAVAGTVLPADLAAGLEPLARRAGTTSFMTLLAVFQTLLRRYTGRDDLPVGTPIANRNRTETEGLVGFFVNALVLRGDLSGDPTFREALRRTREAALAAYGHQDLPFEKLVEALQPQRSLAYTPLFQVVFLFQADSPVPATGGLALGSLPLAGDTAKFDLTLAVSPAGEGLAVQAEYNRDLFDAPTVLRLLEHFGVLLEQVTADPGRRLSELPLLAEAERHALIYEENDTAAVHPDRPVHELFEEQVRRSPQRVAVTCAGQSLTYAELNARANRIAHHLLRLGAGPEERIGVSLERSPDLIAGLLGILKAGAAYLPLDPSLPAERLEFLMADAGITRVLDTEEVRAALASGNDADPESGAGPGSLAYVLYTSGSTGRPKGVEVEHRSIVRLVRGADFAGMDETEVFLQLAPIPFDASTLEIWAPLLNGGRLAVFPPRTPSLEELSETLRSEGISTLWLTAGLFHQMVEAQPESLRGVRQLLAGGDALSVPHVQRTLERLKPGHRLINGYGPTENTTFTCCRSMDALSPLGSSVPIGRPISNTRVYLLGRDLEPVPLGVPGELYAAGEGLARGYLGRPDLTAERFVPSPLPVFPGERLYRTGDLARRLPSGEIEFLGRLDTQVKLRGFRIELGEIEAAICEHPAVRQAVVLAREDRPGDRRLVAYVEVEGEVPGTPELRAYLSRKLPDYMLPAAVVVLEALPLTPNGKVDRRALAAVEPGRQESLAADGDAPRDEIEELLAGAWCQVLGLAAVGVHDDFFELGGHSLLATRVVSRVREVLGVELPLRALFEAPTVVGLAGRLRRVMAVHSGLPPAPPILPRVREGNPPASFAQERLWFLDLLGDERASYNVPVALVLRGALDSARLEAALNEVIRRHEALRTTFAEEEGRTVQVIASSLHLPLPEVDLREVVGPGGSPWRSAEVRRLAREEAFRLFDLQAGPLLRATLLRLAESERLLLLTQHHIVSDGWSLGILLRELSTLYDGSPLAELPVQYADFAVWQREWLAGEVLEAQLAYWRGKLAGMPAVLELPADHPRPAAPSPRGGQRTALLPLALSDALPVFSRRRGATPFMVLLAAFQALLGRITDREDLTVGSPVANRNRAETERLIGFFVNTLVLRADLSGDPGFAELLARVRETALGAYANQDVPFEKLVAELQPERDLSHTPLFQVMLIVQNLPGAARAGWELAPPFEEEGTAKFDLTLSFGRRTIQAEYRRDLLDATTVDRLLGWLTELLAAAMEEPVARIADLPLLAEAERHQVLAEWNDTAAMPSPAACLHERFEAQVDLTPGAEALLAGPERLTYAELDRRANRLARRLRRLGVGPEVRVGIALERTADLVVGLLAILKAGGAYVPLDPAYPRERLALILEDAQEGMEFPVVITQETLLECLPELRGQVLLLDAEREEIGREEDGRPPASSSPGNLAYLIYTSGSTGRPKGVAIEHRSADALIRWAGEVFGPEDLAGVLASTSITFDLSVFELFLPLARGGRIVLAENALALADLPARDEVGLVNTVPSVIAELVRLGAVPESVRTVNLAGEPLKRALVDRLHALSHVEAVFNLYGPSEDTTYSTLVQVPRSTEREPTIGAPIAGTRARVLDRGLRPLPAGVPGELCLAGDGLARGYLNRPDLTAASFVPDPFGGPGERIYCTGDLARWLPGGALEFLGRIDHQVKVRGFRIELGEIETALLAHPGVREAAVLALGEGGERRLAAYVAGEAGPAALRSWVERRLPAYMVPADWVNLSSLPLTPNGKVDRKVLARIEPERGTVAMAAAAGLRTQEEELLAGIWSALLRVGPVGPRDNFFDLGGHSLLATQVVSRAREVLEVELPLRALFEAPTLSGLAARIEALLRKGLRVQIPPMRPVARDSELRASFAQERLWFLDRFGADRSSYNIPAAIRMHGRLDVPALAACLTGIVRRHESLRTTFAATGGAGSRVLQVIAPSFELPLPLADIGGLPESTRDAEAGRLAREEARRVFDLARGPLVRATLVRLDEREHFLLLSMHHIVSDGWSIGVLLRELSELYSALVEGRPSVLPELPVQYADFAAWQRSWLSGGALAAQLGWWRERLAGAPAVIDLPTDRPRPPVQSARGGRLPYALPAALTRDLRALVRSAGATLFMALLAGFQALLARATGSEDLPVGTPIANRNRAETEGLIGFFVNTLVLRGDLSNDPSFRELLARSREATLGAYTHQDVPFEKLVEELRPERDLSHSPLFQVMVILQNAPMGALELPDLTATPLAADGGTTKFDLRLSLMETAEGLSGSLLYNRDLFDASTVVRLGSQLERLLAGAAASPGLPLSGLSLLDVAESHQILREWGDALPVPDGRACLHQVFEARAASQPDRIAAGFEGERLTYRELDERSNRLARFLIGAGVRPGDRVGLCLERSPEMVVAVLAVLKAGGAYLPLDLTYPKERLAFAIEDSGLGVLVTRDGLAADLPAHSVREVRLDTDREAIERQSPESPAVEVTPGFPAYVIYTSGSTGRPKGVMVTHANASRLFTATGPWFGFGQKDVWTLFHSYAFDFSVWELWGALLYGGRLVVVPYWVSRSPEAFYELVRDERVTVLNQTPSAFRQLLWAEEAVLAGEQPDLALRYVIFGGEALELASLAPWYERHAEDRPRLVNMYGITETTVHVTYRPLSRKDVEEARGSVLGIPIPDLSLRVLSRDLMPQPIGVAGEIHIGGEGLAMGYLGRPELTAQRFVPDPFGPPGTRLYRSGDLARYLPDGDLEYLGRIDHQVKIRGFRIELGEIETALAAQPEVREAVVLAREDTPGDRRLVAYLVAETELPAGELRDRLKGVLPEYMVPAAFVTLPALPLTSNGKVDRQALPAPEASAPAARRDRTPPRTALERFLADLWRTALGSSGEIGVEDDFFELGGNSITGAILINRLQEALGEIVHVVVIFDAPTVVQMAAYLVENHSEAVARVWGEEASGSTDRRRSGRVDAVAVERMRSLVRPLPPLAHTGPKNPPAVFVLAPPRSGTTLMRVMLGGHPRLFAPPELELLSYNTLDERKAAYTAYDGRDAFWLEGLLRAVMEIRGCSSEDAAEITERWEEEGWTARRVYGQLQEWLGARILVDKTPSYALDPAILRRAEEDFEEPLYVHLVRHPCGMIRSFEEARLDQIFFRQPHGFERRELAELIWLVSHENILRFLEEVPSRRSHRVLFEELLREPETVLRRLCGFLGIEYDPGMMRPYEDRARRMTDGIHAESRMLGDVKFHTYSRVEASVAERWKEHYGEDLLGDMTARLAASLGYDARPARPSGAIPRRQRRPGEPVPLSFAQERLWFLGQFDPDSAFYNITSALRLAGILDVAALGRSLAEIRRRHSVLRTVFAATAHGTVQIVVGLPEIGLPLVDLGALPPGRARAEGGRLAREEGRRPFDLAAGPMLRTPLLRLGAAEHILVVTMHHIASDGWSLGLLSNELAALYAAFREGRPSPLPDLPVEYADFALWQRERLSGDELGRQIAWWRGELTGAPALIQLPTDRPRPAIQRFRGGLVDIALPAGLSEDLPAVCRCHGTTLFMTLLAVFQGLLSRVSGQDQVVVGSPTAGRNWPETEPLIGFFVNTLVVRGDLRGDPSFREILARTRRAALGGFAHQEVPFERLVEELQPERSLNHSPIFQVMFSLQNVPRHRIELPGLEITAYRTEGGTAKFDLNLLLAEIDGQLFGTLEYNSDLFDRPTAARLLGSFETLLRGLIADPDRRLSDLPLVGKAERHQMLLEWNDTAAPFPDHLCLHQPFEARVEEAPDAVAVIFEDRRLTYSELNRRANRLAHRLRSLGVGPGRLVAVHLERSPEMIVAVLGVHKAGGAYVPVEVSWPAERLRYILESERIGHVVTQTSLLEALPSAPHVVCLDESALDGVQDSDPRPLAGPEDLAYIIFTSGSTGRPKGVMVRHRPAVNLVHWVNTRFGVGASDTLLFITALSFDLSVYDVFGILAAGGTVRIAAPAELRDPEALVKILLTEPVTFWDSAPAALQQLVAWLPADPQPAALRLVFNSGDWIPVALPDRVSQTFPGAEFVSLGGATEATIWSNFFPVREVSPGWSSIPYGRPIENARYHVLDEGMNPCPIGVPGDLHIAGIAGGCLSDGYAGAPELTAQKYVPDPFGDEPGARLYRTGDRARYRPDGNLEFLGRIDTQVKVRGYRIELGEIESVLMAHPAVREAVVLAREDTPGDQRLVAYLIPDGEFPAALELRRFVQARLPDYMVPSAFVSLDGWPVAATGKLDRKALPPPESAPAKPEAAAPVLPGNGLERTIAEIWKEVVGLPQVGVRDNFFDIGGHSLLMARVHARLEEALGRKVSMVDLFQYPTIGALAAHLAPAVAEAPRTVAAPAPVGRRGEDVAVIGLAGRFPGARNVEELWRNLRDEVESIRCFSEEELRAAGFGDEVMDPRFVRARGALAGPDLFDAAFFDYASREAQIIDPQQRHFLECAWEALENAGYGAEAWRRRVGVFAGTTENTYVLNLLLNQALLRSVGRQQVAISNNADYLPTRVSYKLNLRGPSFNVQSACSTSLVAVHLARLSLLRGECEIALAGGVSVKSMEIAGYLYHAGGISSPDGHTRAFDERAQGVVGGSGVGIVVLKRLEDALADGDTIHAVIRGSAVNNDGTGKVGFTAPSVEGQAEVVREAHRAAGIEPGSITYVETHGTGTPMGDPIEAQALIQAFGDTDRKGYCALGSIKTNIGHLDAAAGVAGLIKTVLALENRTIPASLHFERPNPRIPFDGSPFFVNARTREWPADGTPRRAGVSSFGIGGTNAHAVVEEAPEPPASEPSLRPSRLLVLSAKTPTALDAATANLAGWLEVHPDASLDDVAFTLQVGRQPFRHRRAVVCGDHGDAILALQDDSRWVTGSPAANPSVAFLFPGQGSQYARMGEELYEHEPVYRAALDHCCERLRPELGLDLRELIRDPEADLGQTSLTQPALFAVEYALARLWMSWGIRPAAMLGHSIGEYVAACLAGVLSLEAALSLVAARGRLMQELPAGCMLGVSLPEEEVRAWIEGRDLSLAAVNAPSSCVVSGPAGEVEALEAVLEERGIETRPLHTSHAFHSRMMEPIVEPFLERVRRVDLQAPRLPWVSNLTGTWITAEQATDPRYWARHLREPVRFSDGLSELLRLPDPILLETGPGRTLSTLARQHPDRKAVRLAVSSLGHAKDRKPAVEAVLKALGRLWLAGVDVEWTAFWAAERRRRIPLPTYPFERKSYWIGMAQGLGARSGKAALPEEEPAPVPAGKTAPRNPVEETVAAVWRDLLGEGGFGVHDDFFDLGGSSLMAVQLGSLLRQALEVDLPLDFLFQAPTVAALAELVAQLRPEEGRSAERPRSSCLVPLQKGNGRRPLFMVHQVGGNVYTFRALAQALGKGQPLYGLRSRGLEDGEEPFASVEEMAEHYLELLRGVQPAGPYRIGGASMGGMVAFEMAHRLRTAGETVELLTLMDTPCGEQMPPRRLTNEDIVLAGFEGRVGLTLEELLPLSPDEQISHAFDRARRAGALPEGFDEGSNRRRIRVLQRNVAALYAYRPQPYDGRMLFFRAQERRPADPPRPEIAWIDLARGGCDVLLVPGNHETMHEPPHVLSMAERLRSHLAP
jgi:amino acid adenylation domain-containing protein